MWKAENEWRAFQGLMVGPGHRSIFISGLEENTKLELIEFVDYVKVVLSGEA